MKLSNELPLFYLGIPDDYCDLIQYVIFNATNHSKKKNFKSIQCKTVSSICDNFKAINDQYKLLEVSGFKTGSHTRGYKPAQAITDIINESLADYIPSGFSDSELYFFGIDDEYGSIRGSIARDKGNKGNKPKFKAKILNATKVNVQALQSLLHLEPSGDEKERQKIILAKCHAFTILNQALETNLLPRGWIPSVYHQVQTGRLYLEGLNLQNCSKIVRNAALKGYYSYDISNAHYAILNHLSGGTSPAINDYLNNKQAYRQAISQDLDVSIGDSKKALISLIYGASLPKKFNDNFTLCQIFQDSYSKALSYTKITNLHNDIKLAAKSVNESFRAVKGRFAGKVVNSLKLVSEKTKASQEMSHILQGYETQALDSMACVLGLDTALLLHDGIVAYSQWEVKELEAAILKQTGIPLQLDAEVIK